MKPFQIFITSTALLSLFSVYAYPEKLLESSSYLSDEANVDAIDDAEISFLGEEMDEFEEEISALEEEVKKDAESLEENQSQDSLAQVDPLEEEMLEEESLAQADFVAETTPAELDMFEEEETQDALVQESSPFETQDEIFETQILPVDFSNDSNDSSVVPIEELTHSLSTSDLAPKSIEKEHIHLTSNEPTATVHRNDLEPIEVDLQRAFAGAPFIYTILGLMSVSAVGIWLYSLLSLRRYGSVPQTFLKNVQHKLNSNQFDDALSLCTSQESVFSKMISSGILTRRHGLPVMVEAMKAEGKRASVQFWQRIGLLNDIAIIAPMLGLLGTVLGMFYAFYDINRSIESISTLFDGLGVSVGTTVAGLVVAILALILHSTIKFRLVKALAQVENEAQSFATLIDDRTSVYKG